MRKQGTPIPRGVPKGCSWGRREQASSDPGCSHHFGPTVCWTHKQLVVPCRQAERGQMLQPKDQLTPAQPLPTGITDSSLLKNQGRCCVEKHINHTCLHTYAHIHTYAHGCMHAHTANTYMHVHIYAHMCAYLQVHVHTEKMNNSFITHPIGMKEPGMSPQHSGG